MAKAAVGRPKAAVGRQRAAYRLRLAAAAQPHPPICLKIDSLAYNWLIRLLSRTHAQVVSLSVCLCHHPHDMHRHLGTVGYNGDQIQQRNRLGLIWIRSILATGANCNMLVLLVTPINCVLSAHAHAVPTYQTTPTAAFKHTVSISAEHENDHY